MQCLPGLIGGDLRDLHVPVPRCLLHGPVHELGPCLHQGGQTRVGLDLHPDPSGLDPGLAGYGCGRDLGESFPVIVPRKRDRLGEQRVSCRRLAR